MATLKPTTPLHTHNKGPMKPASPLHPKNTPKTPISHPQRRWRFQLPHLTGPQRRRWFQTTRPPDRQGQAAAPAGLEAMSGPAISHLALQPARGPNDLHLGPTTRTLTRCHARGHRRPHAHLRVNVRIKGSTRILKGLRTNNTHREKHLCPKRRPPRPQPPIFSTFRRGGLHCGHHTDKSDARSVTKRGK